MSAVHAVRHQDLLHHAGRSPPLCGGGALTAPHNREYLQRHLVDAVPGLQRYARSIVVDPTLADDLVQATLVRALEQLDTFRGDAGLATWLHHILHNLLVDHLRRTRETLVADVWETVEERWRDSSYTLDAAAVASSAESASDLRDALLRLPMAYRSAVVLHDMEELRVPEIARVHRIGLSAAKQRVRRGRMMLVSALAAGVERRAASHGVPLNCWDARTHLPDYLDNALDARQRRLLEHHLRSCPTCPPLYSAVVASRDAVSRLRDSDAVIPAALAARLHQLRADSSPSPG